MSVTYVDSSVRSGHNPLRDRRLSRVAGPSSLVLFGVTRDLARKKLIPAVYDLVNQGLLPPGFALVGFARRKRENEDFAAEVKDAVMAYARTPFDETAWTQLSEGIRFVQGEFDDDAFKRLNETIDELDEQRGTRGNHAFYLSIPPDAFELVCRQISKLGLAQAEGDKWRRVVIGVQPDEGVTIRFGSKVPGTQMEVRDVTTDFVYGRAFTESSPEANHVLQATKFHQRTDQTNKSLYALTNVLMAAILWNLVPSTTLTQIAVLTGAAMWFVIQAVALPEFKTLCADIQGRLKCVCHSIALACAALMVAMMGHVTTADQKTSTTTFHHSPDLAILLTIFFGAAAAIFLILLLRGRVTTTFRHTTAPRLSVRTEHGLEALGAAVMALMFATMAADHTAVSRGLYGHGHRRPDASLPRTKEI